MIIQREMDGLFFTLESTDFKGDWRTLLDFVKAFKRWEYDDDEKRWWIGEEHVKDFHQYKKQLIDDLLNPNQMSLL